VPAGISTASLDPGGVLPAKQGTRVTRQAPGKTANSLFTLDLLRRKFVRFAHGGRRFSRLAIRKDLYSHIWTTVLAAAALLSRNYRVPRIVTVSLKAYDRVWR